MTKLFLFLNYILKSIWTSCFIWDYYSFLFIKEDILFSS